MTAAVRVKAAGLKNLAQVSEMTGVSRETLRNWFNDKPKLFEIVLKGCVAQVKDFCKANGIEYGKVHNNSNTNP